MNFSETELTVALFQFNPWLTSSTSRAKVPTWKRSVFNSVMKWIEHPEQNRALLLGGARQVGKTTVFLQAINQLLENGVAPGNILYCTFDHPLFRIAGIETAVRLWRELQPRMNGPEYLFLDEIQSVPDWQTWLKHQTDFVPDRRIAVTGSAAPLLMEKTESGVGRVHTVAMPTLSFYEYLQLRHATGKPEQIPSQLIDSQSTLPPFQSGNVTNWEEMYTWSEAQFIACRTVFEPLPGLFNEYLLRGGFPQSSLTDSIDTAQQLLREDILDKVLKRDMTSLYGVRHIADVETLFLYLCMHDGELLDFATITENLNISKKTVQNYLDLFESTYLIRQIRAFGYGKQVLRSQTKVYLNDPAIASSVLVRGQSVLNSPEKMGQIVEGCCFKHLYDYYTPLGGTISFWRGKNEREVDFVLQQGERIIPFEVKYRNQHVESDAVPGLLDFAQQKKINRSVIFTKNMDDFGLETVNGNTILRLPATLGCYLFSSR